MTHVEGQRVAALVIAVLFAAAAVSAGWLSTRREAFLKSSGGSRIVVTTCPQTGGETLSAAEEHDDLPEAGTFARAERDAARAGTDR